MSTVRSTVAEHLALTAAISKKSFAYFLQNLIINASPEPKRFGDCADDWQREQTAPMIPAVDTLAGLSALPYTGPWNFMQVLARGHNKSSHEAAIAAFLLVASKRIIHGYILAADRDQGRLILQAMEDLIRLNPWLGTLLKVTKNIISGPAGFVEVLPCDASSAMGLRGNFYICDEFVHWKRQKEWTAIVTGLIKVQPTLFVAISNAGLKESWQHDAFLTARADPEHWCLFYREGTLATWQDPAQIARDRLLIPPSEARRLFDNVWIDPSEEHDYLRRSEVNACAALGQHLGLIYRPRRQFGVSNYAAGLDYAPRRDRTALVVLHADAERVVRIDKLDVWQGAKEKPVQIADVEQWIKDVRQAFNPVTWVIDPYQMESTIQWMQRQGMPVEPFAARAGAANFEMAQHLRALVADERLAWYPGAGDLKVVDKRTGVESTETLMDELVALRTKKMPYGYRFDHENQKHDDRAVAIAMAALRAVDYPFSQTGSVRLPQHRNKDSETGRYDG